MCRKRRTELSRTSQACRRLQNWEGVSKISTTLYKYSMQCKPVADVSKGNVTEHKSSGSNIKRDEFDIRYLR